MVSEETLKLEINNLIWMCAPETMTLGEAEEIALKIFEMLKPKTAG